MEYFVRGLVIALAISGCTSPNDDAGARFQIVYEVHAPSASSLPFLAGSSEALGSWRPDGVEFLSSGDDVFRAHFHSDSAQLECKLTLGTWESEALDDEGYLRDNRVLNIVSDTLIVDTVRAWNDCLLYTSPSPRD